MALKNRYFALILLLTMLFLSIGGMAASTSSSTWSTTVSSPGSTVNYVTTPDNTYTYSITPYTLTDEFGKTLNILEGATSALEAISTYAKNFEVVNAFIQATGASFGIPKIFKATFEEEMTKSGNSQQETLEKVKQFLIDVGDLIGSALNPMLNFIIVSPEGQKASLADAYQNLANTYQTDIDKDQHADLGTPMLPSPSPDTSTNEGPSVSEIGNPLIGDNSPKAPTSDLPCV
jgi:hypothetical protein